ncbi:MFS transporter [Lysinibacillus irui]|uniref:MFS transporter n=1 Tax=Lysinibacillus irui TaxID=2998077 RepID=A0AAJ5RUG9_9BACI|nr:MFS transporter [Lysinibacillus irui]MEA0552330.1 MFS transporter [Lysinibacillus irui]MEA0563965.1 MFS transporter [Lysinibacillus irui]MEA0977462.1 MFS transporter [Lysinibacillus irui]MEA1043616.1 MFS transporter [Lysinibacillus irui]WDV08360.1 MFS transporter [Lysinibacillus irui]
MQQEENTQIWTKRFISLFLTNISVFFVFYGLVTTLPLYAIGELHQTDKEAGLLLSGFLLSAIIVRPFSGKLLDVFGKKKLLVLSIVGYFICTVLYLFVHPFGLLLGLRFIQGIFFSIITTAAGSLAADIVPAKRKGAGLGYFTMSTNLAVVIGPFIGLLLIQYSTFNVLFIVMSICILAGGILALTVNTDDLPKPAHEGKLTFKFNDLFERKALPVAAIASLVAFSYASVLSFLSVYAQQKDLMAVASLFYAVFAAAMLITRPFTGKLYDTKGPQFVIIPGIISFAIGLVMLAFVEGPVLFLCAAIFVGFGYGSVTTSLQALAVQSTAIQRSGYATATYFTMFDLGIALGSYILGMVAVQAGYASVYLSGACLLGVVFIIYLIRLAKIKPKKVINL